MSDDNETSAIAQDELTTLKARADMMGVTYHPSIGLEKLREKVLAVLNGTPVPEQAPDPVAVESENQMNTRKKREANELIRVRITCMNPAKAEWEGEILTAGNSVVGSVTKYVPFNVEEGWHVPRIILNQMIDRQCQIFHTVKDSRGNSTRKGKLIKEFGIEILPPLTVEDLQELARRQAVSHAIT